MDKVLNVGDLIQFNEDYGVHVGSGTTASLIPRAREGEVGIIYETNKRKTRFKLYTSAGTLAEVTNYDVQKGFIEILASKKIPGKKIQIIVS